MTAFPAIRPPHLTTEPAITVETLSARRFDATRRAFLKGAVAAGTLMVAGVAGPGGEALAQAPGASAPANPAAFVRIGADDTVTVIIKILDKGQGVTTGLAAIVAEELDADWSQLRFAFAPADHRLYNNLLWGPVQGVGGSTSVAGSWMQLRKAGAAARQMLVAAAAAEWNVPASEVKVSRGVVSHGARQARFGALAARAAAMPVPANPPLKDPKDWTIIGKEGTAPRLDSVAKTSGTATFSLDVRRPGMLTAMVAHSPKFGGQVRRFDGSEAMKVKGVVAVVEIPTGVAVVARDTWSAMKGREALKVTWDFAAAETRSTDVIMTEFKRQAGRPGLPAGRRGDAARGLASAARTVEAEFEFPYLAHASMEPMNGTIERRSDGGIEAWAGFQMQTLEQATIAAICGVPASQVHLNTLFAGGSFGRRATPDCDYVAEMAHILKATGYRAPIHLVWTREDDMQAGYFRPMVYHRVKAGVDAAGKVVGWEHRIVGKSILIGSPFEAALVANGVDATTVEGASDTRYAIPNLNVEVHNGREGVPVLWWRSVGHTHTGQVMEVVMDELAQAAGKDPFAFRLEHLANAPRDAAVLRLAAEKAGWGQPLPAGKGRGIAVHESFRSHVAMVAEVTVNGTEVKVDRIVCAVDCGIAVTPDIVRAQVEGAVGFALSSVLRNRVTLKDGEVQETNFDTFEPTRITEMPKVEVHIVASTENPTGIGEPGVPVLGPAISNAVSAATGKRIRSLPIDLAAIGGA
ncbi:molybdopterin cofactor-binding domain-containing protein [Phreatobacter sp.]|uniref:xanthine dehydrogenase family protein molybdopterin-binding subunit n=1 Tax=Phreatobacter sp. TaxID=1966341 RepID=UPI003F723B29